MQMVWWARKEKRERERGKRKEEREKRERKGEGGRGGSKPVDDRKGEGINKDRSNTA